MTVQDFRQKIGAQLARLQENPRFYVQMLYWQEGKPVYSYAFYPSNRTGNAFYQKFRHISESDTPGLVIDSLTININNFLQEYCIPNSTELTLEN